MTTNDPKARIGSSAPVWVFAILLASYAYFWHARDWNTASRLMLTYALVDRGTIVLDGLEDQTRDIAFFEGRYYTDKLPGFSILAIVPYGLAKGMLGLPDHPLGGPALTHWPADYWTTLGTSGLATSGAGALLVLLAIRIGCGPRRAALVGLAYGLATPAYVYGTLAYGHQVTAFALLAAFALLQGIGPSRARLRAGMAGFLAAFAAVVELQVGPVSAILGLYLLVIVIRRQATFSTLPAFVIGATLPTLALLGYNVLAFGDPLDMGYFHHATRQFAEVHSKENPLGLNRPDWSRAVPLLWGGYRGLLYYAPILVLTFPGWIVLLWRRQWGIALVSLAVCLSVFLVNLSYPEWTGGWSTGPRLLVPLLPFAMLPVAALLAAGGRKGTGLAVVLALAGGVLMLLFQGVGARIPQDIPDPLLDIVWPPWRGEPRLPGWERFARNPLSVAWPERIAALPPSWRGMQFLPLIAFQGLAIGAMLASCRRRNSEPTRPSSTPSAPELPGV
ncbi:hypothetical protein BH23PLA1_BH23PLA1_04620 [soil metagenome]